MGRKVLLLDFDGPVCPLFEDGRSSQIAQSIRSALRASGISIGEELGHTHDPFDFLRAIGSTLPPEADDLVFNELDSGEMDAVRVAPLRRGVHELLDACKSTNRHVVIASNNSATAIARFLEDHGLNVDGIIGRDAEKPAAIKPDPEIIYRALAVAGSQPEQSVLFGDSVSDIQAAHAAEVAAVGFGKNPQRACELHANGADAVIDTVMSLAEALTATA